VLPLNKFNRVVHHMAAGEVQDSGRPACPSANGHEWDGSRWTEHLQQIQKERHFHRKRIEHRPEVAWLLLDAVVQRLDLILVEKT